MEKGLNMKLFKKLAIIIIAVSLFSACEKDSGGGNQQPVDPYQLTYDAQGDPVYQKGSQGYAIYNFKDGQACGSEVQNNFYQLRLACVNNIQTCVKRAEEFRRTYPLINCHAPLQRSSGYFQSSDNHSEPNKRQFTFIRVVSINFSQLYHIC